VVGRTGDRLEEGGSGQRKSSADIYILYKPLTKRLSSMTMGVRRLGRDLLRRTTPLGDTSFEGARVLHELSFPQQR
jgi:hypothetical protein